MTWQEFARQNPELATLGEERPDRNGLVMLATLRKNGWPRISPVEPLFFSGQLYLGMMRDPRCSIHDAVPHRHAGEGEFKVYGHAREITDLGERERLAEAMSHRIGIRPEGLELHHFAIDIQSAAANTLAGEEFQHQVWKAA